MKKITALFERLPKWYGTVIVLLYAVLFAEFLSIINKILLSSVDDSLSNILKTIFRMNYVTNILTCVIIWVVTSYLFHLTSLLFNGNAVFKRFLFASSYLYIIPACALLTGTFIADGIEISKVEGMDVMSLIKNNSTLNLSISLVNYSFILYYIVLVILIRRIYKIKYLYATLSIVIPFVSIWLISELFKLI